MRKAKKDTAGKTGDQSLAEKAKCGKEEYLSRLKKMAMYDAKAYLDITSTPGGEKKITLKTDKDIDWDIIETVEINDDKVKVKFPDRSKAMEKYGKVVMGDDEEKENEEVEYIPYFKGEDDGDKTND
jgi:hypothetical protein